MFLRQNQELFPSEVVDVTPEFIITQDAEGNTVLQMANQPFGNINPKVHADNSVTFNFSGNSFSQSLRWDSELNTTYPQDPQGTGVTIENARAGTATVSGVLLSDTDILYLTCWFCSGISGAGDVGVPIFIGVQKTAAPGVGGNPPAISLEYWVGGTSTGYVELIVDDLSKLAPTDPVRFRYSLQGGGWSVWENPQSAPNPFRYDFPVPRNYSPSVQYSVDYLNPAAQGGVSSIINQITLAADQAPVIGRLDIHIFNSFYQVLFWYDVSLNSDSFKYYISTTPPTANDVRNLGTVVNVG